MSMNGDEIKEYSLWAALLAGIAWVGRIFLKSTADGDSRLSVEDTHWNTTVEYLKQQISALQVQNRELLESLSRSHQEIASLRVEIALLKARMEDHT